MTGRFETHVIVDTAATALGRLELVDTTDNKVNETVARLALQAVDVVTCACRKESLVSSELAVLAVVGEEDKLGTLADRLCEVVGVEVECLADC